MHTDIIAEMDLIEARVAAADLSMTSFLQQARLSRSTWWRWREGQIVPGMRAWNRVRTAANRLPWGGCTNGNLKQKAAS